jgi:hypothetical protein
MSFSAMERTRPRLRRRHSILTTLTIVLPKLFRISRSQHQTIANSLPGGLGPMNPIRVCSASLAWTHLVPGGGTTIRNLSGNPLPIVQRAPIDSIEFWFTTERHLFH